MGQTIRKYGMAALLIVCFAVLLMGLAGCRYTDVIRETVYDQTADVVDEEADPIITYLPPEEEDEQEDIDQEEDEIQQREEAEANLRTILSVYGGTLDQGATRSLIYDLSGVNFGAASALFAGGSASKSGKNASKNGNGAGTKGNGTGEQGGKGNGGSGGKKTKIMNPKNYEDLPTDAQAIAAPGEYAEIVCALGGASALAASSSDFISAASSVSSSWSSVSKLDDVFTNAGDGTLKSEGLSTLKSLHKQGKCDTVVLESNDVISPSDLTSLRNEGINVLSPASLSSISNTKQTVNAIGKLLKDKTGGSSVSKASTYSDLCDEVTNTCKNDSGMYTLYVTDWDKSASYTVKRSGTEITSGKGLAATRISGASQTSSLLEKAGVTNTPTLSGFKTLKSTGLYWVNQFRQNDATVTFSASSGSSPSMTGNNQNAYNRELVLAYEGDSAVDSIPALGKSSSFPALIAADEDVAEGLIGSRDSQEGAYTPYGLFSNSTGKGYQNLVGVKKDDAHYVQTLIGNGSTTGSNCYKVYTAPHGLYSTWTDGSMESILFVAWANYKFYGSYNGNSLKSLVNDFYKDFYGNSSDVYDSITKNGE